MALRMTESNLKTIRDQFTAGVPSREIAARLGRSHQSVQAYIRREFGIQRPRVNVDRAQIIGLSRAGHTQREIAKMVGHSLGTVREALKSIGKAHAVRLTREAELILEKAATATGENVSAGDILQAIVIDGIAALEKE